MDDRDHRIGYAAYKAYCTATGRVLSDGYPAEGWAVVSPTEQRVWVDVAEAVSKEVGGTY